MNNIRNNRQGSKDERFPKPVGRLAKTYIVAPKNLSQIPVAHCQIVRAAFHRFKQRLQTLIPRANSGIAAVTFLCIWFSSRGGRNTVPGFSSSATPSYVVVWTGENDAKTISVDANLFENGAKQLRFRLETD